MTADEDEGVGTGADEGATGQDTGTAWVTRSTDCPEAPAQAHPLVSAGHRDTCPVAVEGAWVCGNCGGGGRVHAEHGSRRDCAFEPVWRPAGCAMGWVSA